MSSQSWHELLHSYLESGPCEGIVLTFVRVSDMYGIGERTLIERDKVYVTHGNNGIRTVVTGTPHGDQK